MKKNFCKKLLAFLLALALVVPSVVISANPTTAEAATATEKKNGYTYNKLPYKTNKLAITKLTFSTGSFTATVKNNTGAALSGDSFIPFKCYNKAGEVVKTGTMYLADVNKGESLRCSYSIPNSTVKIIFGKAEVKKGSVIKKPSKTKKVNGIKTNVFPATFSKIKITKVSVEKTKYSTYVTFTYKNNTGKAISGSSALLMKCYDEDGNVLRGNGWYLKDLNKGETAKVKFTLSTSLAEIYVHGAYVREGKASTTGKTQKIDGITTNALPFKKDGIEVTDISIENAKFTLTFKNNTGKNITGTSSISYKSYDTSGEVLQTGSFYLQPLNKGETGCSTWSVASYDSKLSKVIFDEVSIREADAKIPVPSKLVKSGNLKMNKFPYTDNGLKLDFVEMEERAYGDPYYHFTMTNKTGKSIKSPGIKYRVLDKNGNVIEDGSIYGNMMDDGETSACKLLSKANWAEVHFYTGSHYDGFKFASTKTEKIDGLTTNKLPFSNKKLKLKEVSFEKKYSSYTATVAVENNTGDKLNTGSYLAYKCYDKDGNVIEAGNGYGPYLQSGETGNFDISSIPEATVKILFDFNI